MLNKLVFVFTLIGIVIFLYFFYLAKKSQKDTALGLTNSTLHVCSSKPNCVSSEDILDKVHYIKPYSYSALVNSDLERKKQSEIIWQTLLITLKQMNAKIELRTKTYLAVTFSSSFFGFVDDLEARIDEQNATVHFRSASRVGTSDFGVNRKRVKAIIYRLEENLQKVQSKSIKS